MHEVVTRYLTRRRDENKQIPDLVVIDGGKGQLSAALDAARLLGGGLENLPMVSLAKREEEIFLPGQSRALRLSRRSPSLELLQRARDEAHRFAVSFSRKRRTARTITSELLHDSGSGPEPAPRAARTFRLSGRCEDRDAGGDRRRARVLRHAR